MAGHSHWAGIKHKKGVADTKRGKLFSKLAKNIMSAAKEGGADLDMNLKLRYAVDTAKAANMPKDGILRAIQKGTGELPGQQLVELTYEGYGPGGVAILVECLTDNRNRTAPEIRKIFEHRGGNLGDSGCVAWMFEKKGLFTVDAANANEEKLIELALEGGADDVQSTGTAFEITCTPADFEQVKNVLADNKIVTEVAEITQFPKASVDLDLESGKKVLAILDELEEHDDVQNVYSNVTIPDELVEEYQQASGD